MSSSWVKVCNRALDSIGHTRIANLTDTDIPNAVLCNENYRQSAEIVLSEHDWNDAINRKILAPEVTTPAFDYNYQFALPTGFIKIVGIDVDDYELAAGNKLLANSDAIKLKYLGFIEDPNTMRPYLRTAIEYRLALDIIKSTNPSSNEYTAALQRYEDALKDAVTIDSQSRPVGTLDAKTYTEARNG